MEFEAGQDYKTRGGFTARVFLVNANVKYPIIGAIHRIDLGGWVPARWTAGGQCSMYTIGDQDLVPPKRKGLAYLFLYSDGMVGMSDDPRHHRQLGRNGVTVLATAITNLEEGTFEFPFPADD